VTERGEKERLKRLLERKRKTGGDGNTKRKGAEKQAERIVVEGELSEELGPGQRCLVGPKKRGGLHLNRKEEEGSLTGERNRPSWTQKTTG